MNNECRERLLKLIPLLASDKDGEVLAAVRAIERTLKSHKTDFFGLAASIQVSVRESYVNTKPKYKTEDFYYSTYSTSSEPPPGENTKRGQKDNTDYYYIFTMLSIVVGMDRYASREDMDFITIMLARAKNFPGSFYISEKEKERLQTIRRKYTF